MALEQPVLARGPKSALNYNILACFGICCMVIAVVCRVFFPKDLWVPFIMAILGGGGLICTLAAIYTLRRDFADRAWVTLHDSGFTITDRGGEQRHSDDDVLSMALSYKKNYSEGMVSSVQRTFKIWLLNPDGLPTNFLAEAVIKVGTEDPLKLLIDRLFEKSKKRAKIDREQKVALVGDHWRMEGYEITLRPPNKPEVSCTLDQIVAIDTIDMNLTFWIKDRDEPFAAIPLSGANAHLLGVLIEDELASRPKPAKPAGPPQDGRLGRIIFQKSAETSSYVFVWILLIVTLGATLGFAIWQLFENQWFPSVFAGLSLLAALGSYFLLKAVQAFALTCHEYGVVLKESSRTKKLLYTEIQKFTYRATRMYYNGVYTGTALALTFDPGRERKADIISYNINVQKLDDLLDDLRDQISRIIGFRIVDRFKKGETIEWGPRLKLIPEGIEYRTEGLFGKSPFKLLPYSQITGFDIQEGFFRVWQVGQKKSVINEPVGSENFFPGFFAFAVLMGPSPGGATGSEPAEAETT